MTKRTRIKIWIIVLVIWMISFSDWSFAAEEWELKILWFWLNYIVSILAWIWIFFANLAGTFLTNSWVYAEALWLDVLFWKYWNVTKNIANFWLWFYFVYVIFRWLIKQWKEKITDNLKNILLWLLIAWVWIQASWFFVATVIDVSTITLAAAGSFPSQVISQSPYVESTIRASLFEYLRVSDNWDNQRVEQGKQISLFPKDQKAVSFLDTKIVKLVHVESLTGLVDSLMPNANDVSWPLYFIWLSILKTNVLTSIDTSSDKWIKATILNTIIQWWTTIVFSIEMIILCVLALIRIIYLWMFIVLSPIAVLIWCIEKSWQKIWKDGKWFLAKFTDQISFKTFFINVFRPTIIVLWFWVAVIFVSLMNKVVIEYSGKVFDMEWVTITSVKDPGTNISNEWDQTYTTHIDGDFVHFTLVHSWKTLLELILSILTVLIVYFVISFAMRVWKWNDFVSKGVNSLQNWLETLVKSTPIIPVSWYDKNGARVDSGLSFNWLRDIPGAWIQRMQSSIDTTVSEQTDDVMKMLWFNKWERLTESQKTGIRSAWWPGSSVSWIKILEAKRDYIKGIKTDKWMWMTLGLNPRDWWLWKSQFTGWLDTVTPWDLATQPVWKDMVNEWRGMQKQNKSLAALFDTSPNRQRYIAAYADLFELKNVKTWNDLMNKDISSNDDTK